LKGEFSFFTYRPLSVKQIVHTRFLKGAINIVLVNGRCDEKLSDMTSFPIGLEMCYIADASSNELFQKHFAKYADINTDAFIALNTALANGGVFIHVAKGAVIESPIHLINISSAEESTFVNSRNLIVVE
jgi:Fe-S cluster assembly protein SufD